jgi:hypothetical protein
VSCERSLRYHSTRKYDVGSLMLETYGERDAR